MGDKCAVIILVDRIGLLLVQSAGFDPTIHKNQMWPLPPNFGDENVLGWLFPLDRN